MSKLSKLKFHVLDKAQAVKGFIRRWKPRGCKTEKDFQESLYNYLHKELGDIQITKEYGIGRNKADIVVADKIAIEIKYKLDTTGKLDRLKGQLRNYKKWDGEIIVLLTGSKEPNLKKELKEFIRDENNRLFDEKYYLIEK